MDQTVFIPPNVTPQVGLITAIGVGGVSAQAIQPGAYSGYIMNPKSAADQGLMSAEDLFVDPFAACQLQGFNTTIRLAPGDIWFVPIAKSTLPVWVNAATSGHQFTCVFWVGP